MRITKMSANLKMAALTPRKHIARDREQGGSGVPPLNQGQKQRRDASVSVGHEPKEMLSAIGAKEVGELPKGWQWVTLREVADIAGGVTKGQKRRLNENVRRVPYLRVANVQRGYFDLSEVKEIDASEAEIKSLRLQPGDILFNEGGDRDKLGRGWVWNGELPECIHQNHVFRARLRDYSDSAKFISYYSNSAGQRYFYDQGKHTTNLASINLTKLGALPIPLPPPDEQRRIVAEIEKQFTRLDAGVAALRRVQANLKRYRAAVLKAACEGRLVPTEAELAKAGDRKAKFETGEELLKRILVERRKNWRGRGKYKDPADPDIAKLPSLPGGWVWASVAQISFLDLGFAFRSSEFAKSGIRLLRGENLEPGKLRWTDTRYWPESKMEGFRQLLIREGEIVLAMDRPLISSGLKIARACADDVPSLLVQRMARFRPIIVDMTSFFFTALNTKAFVRHLLGGQTGTQLPHISGDGIQSFSIALPPLAEQVRIVEEVERRLSVVEELESVVSGSLQRASRLRQSILSKAFSGRILPTGEK